MLSTAHKTGLKNDFVQVLLRHGAIEAEEVEEYEAEGWWTTDD